MGGSSDEEKKLWNGLLSFLLIAAFCASLILPCPGRQTGERMVAEAATAGVKNVPVDQSVSKDKSLTDFKVAGYFPSWKPDKLACVDFDIETHVCYAFAIPKSDGTLRALENPKTAKALIRSAHKKGAKVLLSVGGWDYHGTIVKAVPGADKKDHVSYNGMDAYYNGVGTITKKARYAKENLGGVMVWELTMDTANKKKSLLQAISKVAHGKNT